MDEVETFLKQRIQQLFDHYGWESIALETMTDHVHLFVSAPPKFSPLMIATTLKSILTVDVFKQFGGLKQKKFCGSGLFNRGTHYGSAGTVSAETIKRHIKEQKDAE